MEPADFFEDSTVVVSEETYTVYKTDRPISNAFATIEDGTETTVVAESNTVDEAAVIQSEGGWRLLTFDVVLPFELVGFLAEIATALAAADVSIFVLSAYSTDHVLVKEADVEAAVRKLDALGCSIQK